MTALYHATDDGGIKFVSARRPGDVRIPNYVYDLWMPLLGAEAIGVYGVYCRLERAEVVKRITLVDLARACRVGKTTLYKLNEKLIECGFIRIDSPTGRARLQHHTIEITIYDPPVDIPAPTIEKYQHPQGYKVLAAWLVDEAPEVPDRTSGSPNQDFPQSQAGRPSIESPVFESNTDISPSGDSSQSVKFTPTTPVKDSDSLPSKEFAPELPRRTVTRKLGAAQKANGNNVSVHVVSDCAGKPPVSQPPIDVPVKASNRGKAKPNGVDVGIAWHPLFNAVSEALFNGSQNKRLVGYALHGNPTVGSEGLIAIECRLQGKAKAELDYTALALDVPAFWADFRRQYPEIKQLFDSAKIDIHWQGWRKRGSPTGLPAYHTMSEGHKPGDPHWVSTQNERGEWYSALCDCKATENHNKGQEIWT